MTISHRTRALQAVHFHSDTLTPEEKASLINLLNYEGGKGGYAWFTEHADYKVYVWCAPDDKEVLITVIRYQGSTWDNGSKDATVKELIYDWSR